MATPNPSFQGVSEERGSVRKRVYRRRSWPSRPCDRNVQAQGGGQLRVRPRPPVLPRAAKPSRRLALRDERRIAAGGMLQEAQRRPAVSRRVGQRHVRLLFRAKQPSAEFSPDSCLSFRTPISIYPVTSPLRAHPKAPREGAALLS